MFIHDIYILGESDPFEIKARQETIVNLELEKAPPCFHTFLSGKVLYKNLPIRNATVMVLDDNCSPLFNTLTDENGIYSFRNILKPGKYKVIASAIGYNTSDIKKILIKENKITTLSFSLKKSLIFVNGIVYGKILEAGSRKPIEDADIYIKSSDTDIYIKSSDADERIYKTKSNHNGQYLIYNILPNTYKIVIHKQGYIVTEPLLLKIDKYNRICLYFDLIRDTDDCKDTISGMTTVDKNL